MNASYTSRVNVVTIAAGNYIARVRVLAESFFAHHPTGTFSVLIVDDPFDEFGDNDEPFDTLKFQELSLAYRDLRAMAMFYDVTEFSTALKPWAIEAMINRRGEPVIYLDPDIQIFGNLAALTTAAQVHGLVLTPHVITPIPRDGLLPEEKTIMAAGQYNLGFIGVSDSTASRQFLSWWQERLRFDAIIDPYQMLFTDQRWIDMVPCLFPHTIERNPGYNVAYWNLHERPLSASSSGKLLAGGEELRFFHFSGYSPSIPHLLSKFGGNRPRVLLSENPVLRGLCDDYRELLTQCGEAEARRVPYLWGTLPYDLQQSAIFRRLYRDAMKAETSEGTSAFDITQQGGVEKLMRWAFDRDDEIGGMPPFVSKLFEMRPDLHAAYNHPQGGDPWLAEWVSKHGAETSVVPAQVVPRLVKTLREPQQVASFQAIETGEPAVNVIGYTRAELGIGEATRRVVLAMQAAHIRCRVTPYHRHVVNRLGAEIVHDEEDVSPTDCDVVLIHVNADQLVPLSRDLGDRFLTGRYRIGYWYWEIEEFPPAMWPAYDYIDEIWVASTFVQKAISAKTDKPVVRLPPPIVPPSIDKHIDRKSLGLPEGFLFLFVFDFLSIMSRKNPLGLVEAFADAFPAQGGPILLIKSINGDKRLPQLEQLRIAAIDRPDIIIWDGFLDPGHVGALMNCCDCYVSLHRSEGFGLTIAEAMSLGKPAIATGYSGNTDFMNEKNSFLVPYTLARIGTDCDPYPSDATWADPDLQTASELMQFVVEHPEEASRRGVQARKDVLNLFSPNKTGERMMARFQELRRHGITH